MLHLKAQTSPQWVECVLADFDTFLLDHANCEKKASASALRLATHYPDRRELAAAMIDLACEELQHFQQVFQIIDARGLTLAAETRDPYIRAFIKHVRTGRDAYLLDRLLVFGVVEARGCERFGLVADALPAGEMKTFYEFITASEARHHGLFVRMARLWFSEEVVAERQNELLAAEAEIVAGLELRPTLH